MFFFFQINIIVFIILNYRSGFSTFDLDQNQMLFFLIPQLSGLVNIIGTGDV